MKKDYEQESKQLGSLFLLEIIKRDAADLSKLNKESSRYWIILYISIFFGFFLLSFPSPSLIPSNAIYFYAFFKISYLTLFPFIIGLLLYKKATRHSMWSMQYLRLQELNSKLPLEIRKISPDVIFPIDTLNPSSNSEENNSGMLYAILSFIVMGMFKLLTFSPILIIIFTGVYFNSDTIYTEFDTTEISNEVIKEFIKKLIFVYVVNIVLLIISVCLFDDIQFMHLRGKKNHQEWSARMNKLKGLYDDNE